MTQPAVVHQLGEEFQCDPYAVYRRLQAAGPVHRVRTPDGVQAWLVTSYEHGRLALADPRLSRDVGRALADGGATPEQVAAAQRNPALRRHMLNADPPDHTRLRTLVGKAFTMRRVEALRPRIEAITDELLDVVAPCGHADLIDEFAFPLPMTVICELVGVPTADRETFRRLSNVIVQDDCDAAEMAAAAGEMDDYLVALVAAKREAPGEDLLSGLVAARDEGDRLSEDELVAMLLLLLVAGYETTVNLIGNGALALLRHPAQLAALRRDPSRADAAVEEMLRLDAPLGTSLMRFATVDLEIGGVRVAPGELVLVALGAIGRDPDRFPDPDVLEPARGDRGHLSFGFGVHHCVGAPLARLEGRIAVRELLRRLPGLRLAVPVERLQWRPSMLMRGLRHLPVSFAPQPAAQ